MAKQSFNISKLSVGACPHTHLAARAFDARVISLALKISQFFHLKGPTVRSLIDICWAISGIRYQRFNNFQVYWYLMGKKSGILVSHYPHQPGRACLGYQTSLIVTNLHCSLQNKAHYTSNDQQINNFIPRGLL